MAVVSLTGWFVEFDLFAPSMRRFRKAVEMRNGNPRHVSLAQVGMSRRRLLGAAAGAVALGGLPYAALLRAQPATAQSGKVVIGVGGGAWEHAQDVAYFEPFQKEFGIEIVKVPIPDLAKYRAMVSAGNIDMDISNEAAGAAFLLADEGLLEPIDYSVFDQETLDGLIPETKTEYGVSTLIYSLIMSYRTDKFTDKKPGSWTDFWDTASFPGPRTLASGEQPVNGCLFEVALLGAGVAPADLYPLDFDRAFASLDKIKDDVVAWWVPGAQAPQLLTDGQVDLASAWNGRIQDIKDQGAPVDIVWNQGILQFDLQFVLKDAPNKENAMKLIAYMSRADRQAIFAENIAYAPPNSKAYDFIDAKRAEILPTAPGRKEQQVLQDYKFWNSKDASGKTMIDTALERWTAWITS